MRRGARIIQRGPCGAPGAGLHHSSPRRRSAAGRFDRRSRSTITPLPSATASALTVVLAFTITLTFTFTLALGIFVLPGCTSGSSALDRQGFDSSNPSKRLRATREAAPREDPSAIPRLIEGLESDDLAVRFMSIHTLRRLTGETYDYGYADPPWQRREAVRRWIEAWERGDLGGGAGEPSQDGSPPENPTIE